MNKPGSTGDDTAPAATITRPADENTPVEQVGTIVETPSGLAIETQDGLIALDPEDAKAHTTGERVQVPKNSLENTSNMGSVTVPDDYVYDPDSKITPSEDVSRHDYCTKSPDQFPSPGQNADFSGACARHDMCYDRADAGGYGYQGCNDQLARDMQTVCTENYTSSADPRQLQCKRTALGYWSAVTATHLDQMSYGVPLDSESRKQ